MNKYTREQVDFIQARGNERITEVLDALGIEYYPGTEYIKGPCPIHRGDNPGAFFFALRTNHWRCMTRHCEQSRETGSSTSIFGLVRGVMKCDFYAAVHFVESALGLNGCHEGPVVDAEMRKFLREAKEKRAKQAASSRKIKLADLIPILEQKRDRWYYAKRGVSDDTISRYHVCYCSDPHKPFYQRAFFPVLDVDGKYVMGWSGRSVWDRCPRCRRWHNPDNACPPKKYAACFAKWKHSHGFRGGWALYNSWYAKPFIIKSHRAILCEGPADIWALDAAGIKDCVGIFGTSLSKPQCKLLQKLGALHLVLALDPDEAGRDGMEKIAKEFGIFFDISTVELPDGKDIDQLPQEVIRRLFGE